MTQEWWRPCIAEFVGVFALVYIGAGSIVMTSYLGWANLGAQTLLVVALAHGLAIGTMVTALAHISGAHFNPAVTVAALFTRRIDATMGALYILFQLLGGVFGAFLLTWSLPAEAWQAVALGTPMFDAVRVTAAQAVLIEAILTFFLVFVIFGAGIDPRNRDGFKAAGGLAIGLVVTMDILMGGPLTGAAMNPARAFGPALVSQTWTSQWVYWSGPLLGGLLAGVLYDSSFLAQSHRPGGAQDTEPSDEDGPRTPPLEPEPNTTPGGHDPTSLEDPGGR